jgi:cell division protein FtsA
VQEIKRSGYDGLLPAGMILTGGASALPGIRGLASRVMGLSVRLAEPENLFGMVDKLEGPAYSTGVGLLRWAMLMSEFVPQSSGRRGRPVVVGRVDTNSSTNWDRIKSFLRSLLP